MKATPAKQEGKNHQRRWPLFQGILPFDESRLTPAIVAGITLATLGIPEGRQRRQAIALALREVGRGPS